MRHEPIFGGELDLPVEAQLARYSSGSFLVDQGAGRRRQPVVEAGQEEAQRRAARQDRQRRDFGIAQRPDALVALEQRHALGDVVGAILLEAPGVQADRDVIGEQIVAGEIEIDQAGQLVAEEEDVVGKEIGMDDAGRQVLRPVGFEEMRARRRPRSAGPFRPRRRGLRICPRAAASRRRRAHSAGVRSKPSPATCICASALPTSRQCLASGLRSHMPSRKEISAAGRPDELAEQRAIPARHRQRAGQAARRPDAASGRERTAGRSFSTRFS